VVKLMAENLRERELEDQLIGGIHNLDGAVQWAPATGRELGSDSPGSMIGLDVYCFHVREFEPVLVTAQFLTSAPDVKEEQRHVTSPVPAQYLRAFIMIPARAYCLLVHLGHILGIS
jgi:hypothetical protein